MPIGVIFSLMLLFSYSDGTSNLIPVPPKVFQGPTAIADCENARLRAVSMAQGSAGLIRAFPHCDRFPMVELSDGGGDSINPKQPLQ